MNIDQLIALKESIEKLPKHALGQPITHYDYLSFINILMDILKSPREKITHEMKWKHIRKEQPKHGESIIQCDAPYEGHYTMGMRNYYQLCTWEEILEHEKQGHYSYLEFWWMSVKDFPFPGKEDIK